MLVPTPRLHRWPLLKSPAFRLFALGQTASNTGTWIQKVAQDWLALQLSHGNGTVLGITTALQFLPLLLLGPYGGVLVDRHSTRRILLASQTVMAALALVPALLVATGTARLDTLYVLALALGLTMVVEKPALQAFIGESVAPGQLVSALAFNSAALNLARMAGPALAGPLIVLFGPGPAFLANTLSYLTVIACLLRMDPRAGRPAPPLPRAQRQVREGLRYVRDHRELALTLVLVAVVAAFGMNFQITTALMITRVYRAPAAVFGLGNTALAAGSVIGSLLAARHPRVAGRRLAAPALAFGTLETGCALMPGPVTFLVLLVPTGTALLVFLTAAKARLQLGVGDGIRGRIMSLYLLATLGTTPLLAPLIGWIAQSAGPRTALALGGAVSAAAAITVGLLHPHPPTPPGSHLSRPAPAGHA
ncbi:putative MFS family arabinose efflux permease [Streptomyces sp. 3211.6]|uniref:MFS transporter n=1 Tax=Streptomyces sp. 3211.6 TaxID=1938845 RepID=UPI000CCAC55D|nr:MFS transporter [Streptomyces sp. 3211.6]RKT08306.1 putative MFS family arabinose efflux permease [Streptomyces sp. 3211.6]